MKAREYWIQLADSDNNFEATIRETDKDWRCNFSDVPIHVIEYSAYEELLKKDRDQYNERCRLQSVINDRDNELLLSKFDIENLKRQNEIMRESLEFYAMKENWTQANGEDTDVEDQLVAYDAEPCEPFALKTYGKRARAALSKCGKGGSV